MMSLLLTFTVIVVLLLVGTLIGAAFKSPWPKILYVISAVFLVCGLVTYTPDWDGYTQWMFNDTGRDIVFQLLSAMYRDYGYEYSVVHMTYVLLHASMLVFLCSKLTKNYFVVVLIYLFITYLFFTTQIRFFLAYFSFCLAAYTFFVLQRKWIGGTLLLFAVLNHTAVTLMLLFIPFLYIKNEKTGKYVIFFALGVWSLFGILEISSILPGGAEYFSDYTSSDLQKPGFLGSLFLFGPYLLSAILIFLLIYRKKLANMNVDEDRRIKYALSMSIAPMIYLPIAFGLQIVGQRLIVSSLIFHLCVWIIFFKHQFGVKKGIHYLCLFGVWIYFAFFTYLVPYVMGMKSYLENSLMVLQSNALFLE